MVTYRVENSGNSTLKLVGKAETFRYLALGLSENDGLMGDDSVTFCYDARHQIHISNDYIDGCLMMFVKHWRKNR